MKKINAGDRQIIVSYPPHWPDDRPTYRLIY